MKRILIIVTNFKFGGTNKSLKNLSALLDGRKYRLDLFAMDHSGPYQTLLPHCRILAKNKWIEALIGRFSDRRNLDRVSSIFIKGLRYIMSKVGLNLTAHLCRWAARRLSEEEYDTVIAFSEGVPTLMAFYVVSKNKIAWVRCDYSNYLKRNGYPNERVIYKSFDSVVCVSEYAKREFIRCMPFMAKKTHAICNVIDTSFILDASKENIDDARFDDDKYIILSIGRIDTVKRFSQIPEIARSLLDRNCKFRWYVLGGIDQFDEYLKFKENMKRFDTGYSVIWLGEKNNPYPYIAHSNLLVSLSSSEACPNVINEAKILHIPVVCADFGSASEFVEDGIEGYIVPLEQIADRIEKLIKNKEEYDRIKKNLSKFSYSNEKALAQIQMIL